ncbi:MAG: penicillin-binding transpeptidase domain-containing protein [Polyangiaceae bacterium]
MNSVPLLALAVCALRASCLLTLAFVALFAARRSAAALRRCVLLFGLGAALAVPLLAVPFPGRPVVLVSAGAVTARVVAEALSNGSAVQGPAAPRAAGTAAPASRMNSAAWLFLAWGLGALIVAARAVVGVILAKRLVNGAQAELAGARVHPRLEGPLVVGLFRPVILLPVAAAEWSAERLRSVLLHESAHVRRWDGLALFGAQCVCALYWFQPLAWLAAARLRRECELAADESVLAAGVRASTYAEHLLAIARSMHVPASGIAMAARPSELARRIGVLVSREHLPAPLTRGRVALLAACALPVVGFVACADTAPQALSASNAPKALVPAAPAAGADAKLQSIATDEAFRVHREWGAKRVAILVLDPKTGALLASSDDSPGLPVVPGSTLKPLTVAMALDGDWITSEQRFDCGNGTRTYGEQTLRDAGQYGSLSTAEILAVSSNIGLSRIFDVLGGERLADGLRKFKVGAPPSIPSASLRGAIVAIGEGSTTTPLALTAAYGVFANDGVLAPSSERIIKDSTARTVRSMLEGVVTGERATGKAASVPGVRVGGKTGTSDDPDCAVCAQGPGLFASFVGIVPIDQPRYVIYVGVGQPDREGSGGTIAAPVFARIAARALAN